MSTKKKKQKKPSETPATEQKRIYDLKKYVLEPSLKQIDQHTDITASYEQHKKGRVITGFSFKFKQKNTVKTLPKKPKRKPITRKEAESMARVGETWEELYKRLSSEYIIV